jgi:uncharacterized membrane protein YjfL (UPF0719 family)
MKPWIGRVMIAIGIIHTVTGLFIFKSVLLQLLSEGLVNTVNGEWDREAAFWFLFSGFMMMLVGGLVHRAEQEYRSLPSFFSWGLLGMVVLALCIMPASGWWVFLIPLAGLFWRQRKVIRPSTFY